MKNNQNSFYFNRVLEMFNKILKALKVKEPDEWLTMNQVSTYSKLSEPTLHRYIRRGQIKVSKQTGRLLFKKSNVDAFLEG
jgi:excisionase family DNA binding protein